MKFFNWHKELTRYHVILFAILAGGAAIRLYGINYDLPFIYDQDEPILVTFAMRMLKNRDLNPHWFGHPATTELYLLAGVYAMTFLVGWCLGIFRDAEEFRKLYYTDPTIFYLNGRILSVVFAIATIWLVYKIGRRLHNVSTGLIAAGVVALAPVHIFLSQQVRNDVLMAFLLLVAFWFCLDIVEKQYWKSYLLAGFFTGLAIVTKYPAVVFVLTIALSHFLTTPTWRPAKHLKLLGSAAACLSGMFAGSPFFFLDFRTVLKDVIQEARPEHLSGTGAGVLGNIFWYGQGPLPNALSAVGLVLAVVGIVLCLRSKQKSRWVLVSFPILFLLFISSLNLRWERWILPAIPFLGLLLALTITHFAGSLAERFNRRVAQSVAVILLLGVFVPLFISSISHARQVSWPNTSTLARQWLMDHVPAGSRIIVEAYGPPLPETFKVFVVDENGGISQADNISAGNYQPGWDIGRIKNLSDLPSQGIEYFVMTSFYGRFADERNKYPDQAATYEKLMSKSNLLYEVEEIRGVSRGTPVRVYQLVKNSLSQNQ